MKPLSPHWADIAALKIVKKREDSSDGSAKKPDEPYVVASGITPSGKVHVGNFREVITVDLVARALASLGKNVRFIYSWDNFDTFRKVPKNVPDGEGFVEYLRKPIARIPDPWGNAQSYAEGRIRLFEDEVKEVGISPEFIYQEAAYAGGNYAEGIRRALESKDVIAGILNQHRSTPLPAEWLPTSVYCSECQKDEMVTQSYDGGWNYSYECASCGHKESFDIRESKNIKLGWRVDWPMRWAFEKVDFEPGGKDHSSEGGSFDTAKDIVADVYNWNAPEYLQYDFVMIKGGSGKMSSSSGELITLGEVLEVYDPQIVRWIFAGHRPNHDFALAFDEDVIKIHEEFDKAEQVALGPVPKKLGKYPVIRRTYELSLVDGNIPEVAPYRAPFRELCSRLQIFDKDIERTKKRYYADQLKTEADVKAFDTRAACAIHWLENHAPAEFVFSINKEPVEVELSDKQNSALVALKEWVGATEIENLSPKEINDFLYSEVVHKVEAEPREVFLAVYKKIISRDRGPRLPSFLKEVGKERILQLL